jgi:transposase
MGIESMAGHTTLKDAIACLLDLPDIEVQDAVIDKSGDILVTVKSTEQGTCCLHCQQRIEKSNGFGEWITVRHLDLFGKRVFLRFRRPRYQCECDGQPTTTQRPAWMHHRSPFTLAFERHLLLSCVNSTPADVAIKESVGYEAIQGTLDRHIRKEIDWNQVDAIPVLGIDEVSLKKGHDDFVAIVTARCAHETIVLAVLKDRLKHTVKDFFLSIPKKLRRTVEYVCSDMYDGFINAAKEVFGKRVRVVADRFHVAKCYRDGLETLRKQELKRLRRELAPAAYKALKGAMWALRKKDPDLTDDERKVLTRLFDDSPSLKAAYDFQNQLTAIFDQPLSRTQAKRRMNGWIARVRASGLRCFDAFITTLLNRKDEIANYFLGRHNSGFVEGLNNKIKVMKRRCYGLFNIHHLFQRLSLDLSGYKLYASYNQAVAPLN